MERWKLGTFRASSGLSLFWITEAMEPRPSHPDQNGSWNGPIRRLSSTVSRQAVMPGLAARTSSRPPTGSRS
jgi:hypothetical protein